MTSTLRYAGWSLLTMMVAGVAFSAVAVAQEGEEAKPELKIKQVMKAAHVAPEGGKSLLNTVVEGEATPEQKLKLLDLYINLAENKPPRGSEADWQKRTFAILLSAAKVVVGREGADAELKKAVNCAACHKEHKPPQ